MWSKRGQEARKQNVTSFRSKITRRKRKLAQFRTSNHTVQFITSRLLDVNASMRMDLDTTDCKGDFVPIGRYSDTYLALNSKYKSKHTDKESEVLKHLAPNSQKSPPNNIAAASSPTLFTVNSTSTAQSNSLSTMQFAVKTPNVESKRSTNKKQKKNAKTKTAKNSDNTKSKPAEPVDKTAMPVKNNKRVEKDSDNNSYLKRVKSKIYKSRSSDSSASVTSADSETNTMTKPLTTKIPKNKKAKEKKSPDKFQNKIPKINENIEETFPNVQFRNPNFPFLRQYSNLERVRPRTFGLRSSASNVGISDLVDSTSNILKLPVEQPKLIKSKSSSAINLNLLRSRRSKILQEESRRSCKNAETEFNFIAYGSINRSSVSVVRKFGPDNPIDVTEILSPDEESFNKSFFENDPPEGDRPLGQPVSRSSSDKRPDAVTEEATRGSADGHDAEVDAEVSHDNLNSVHRAKSSQPAINRSESYKEQSQKRRQIRERRKISDPNLSKSNDVDSDHQELSYHSGSSSNSSLSSSRSSESPQSTSLDQVPGAHVHHHHHHHHHSHSTASAASAAVANWDSDVDIEPDPPDWQSSVSEDVLARLHPEEKKRQEIINELFHTERSHVRNLKVLETVFYRPLLQNKCLPPDQVRLLFPNLEEMLDIHGTFNAAMKARRKEEPVIGDIGELLLDMFDGQAGDTFKEAAAKFCARQQLALESLKEKRRKDPRLNSFLTDCESDKLCKRLQLKDIIPTGMQRLVKYPLLFESLARCTERVVDSTMTDSLPSSSPTNTPTLPQMGPTPEELVRLKRALERSKEILNYVNQAVKEAEDKARLQDIQKRLDKTGFEKIDNHPIATEFRSLDLTKHKLIHEGPLLWRINKQNKLSVHVILMEEIVLLLQKQDEKYILKFHVSGSVIHSPIVKVSTVLVRHNATEKDSLYLVNTSQNGAQIYDLSAQSPMECRIWFKHISDAAEAYKSREGKSRRSELSTPEPEAAAVDLAVSNSADLDTPTDTDSTSAENSARNSGVIDDDVASAADKRLSQTEPVPPPAPEPAGQTTSTPPPNDVVASGGSSKREAQMRLAGDDQPLIQPSEVTVNVLPVHTAQPVITPIEQVRRKDEAIRQALAEKEALVAEILHVPPEDYHTIADMAGDITGEKEPSELVLAAVNQANLLSALVSDSLNISEAVQVASGSSGTASCTSAAPVPGTMPTVPAHKLSSVANALNSQLTALLRLVKEREEERERMRRELQKLREQLHSIHETNPQHTASDTDIFHSAGDLANIEEDP